ncbi:hypothetical protein Mic7113_2368 [Allocoleopsis franciscana PCC 7113]|uniref:Uncharacterized protein n=1 Tax=Allocoleopsis franciscana PCC 7113 TaxID=1173027 RepID=K9WD80_9CYAN|nr:hypothetical protein Mic7113_2368 [Allocoleopsis franciscana PCC 7113]
MISANCVFAFVANAMRPLETEHLAANLNQSKYVFYVKNIQAYYLGCVLLGE